MNTLVSLGTGVAFAYSAFTTIWPGTDRQIYFDAVLMILGFLLLGKALEGRAKRRALAALDSLSRLRPSTARRVLNGMETIVPLEEIRPGDSIVVLPGERFPVDATVLEGRSTVDESMLTGEPTPQPREVGGRVLAGSLNYDGAVVCRAESLGEATVLAQITRLVKQAQSSRAPMERLADRASSIFVPVVLGLAVVTFAGWLIFAHSLRNGVGKYGCSTGDRLPLRDGVSCSCCTNGRSWARRSAWCAFQGRRGTRTTRTSGRCRSGQDGHSYSGPSGAEHYSPGGGL